MRNEFTGKERDAETGLDYFGARYMSAAQGRSPDPVSHPSRSKDPGAFMADPQRWNAYSYVRNNPLLCVDPDGREPRIKAFSSSTCSPTIVAEAADQIAVNFQAAGVQNVTVTVVAGRPGFGDLLKGFLIGKPHSLNVEFRPEKKGQGVGSQAIPTKENGRNIGGTAAVDAGAVDRNAGNDDQAALGLAKHGYARSGT